jgi:hypothetical protein
MMEGKGTEEREKGDEKRDGMEGIEGYERRLERGWKGVEGKRMQGNWLKERRTEGKRREWKVEIKMIVKNVLGVCGAKQIGRLHCLQCHVRDLLHP